MTVGKGSKRAAPRERTGAVAAAPAQCESLAGIAGHSVAHAREVSEGVRSHG